MTRDSRSKEMPLRRQPAPGVIQADALYRLDEVQERMGWATASYRAACRRGLPVLRAGKRAYVLGSDLIAFIANGATQN